MRKHRLTEIEWPSFGTCEIAPRPDTGAFEARIDAARDAMASRGLSHLVVYGDREHFANLHYLTGFDPRFEEALLILGLKEKPLLLVGNECEGYLTASPIHDAGGLRHERYPSFSLISQPREGARPIRGVFLDEGIAPGSGVGCAGWKYFTDEDFPGAATAIEIPAYIVDALRALAGAENVLNATDLFMHPRHGLRSACSASEIAFLEYSNIRASEGMKRMLFGVEDGMLDYDLAKRIEYAGDPFSCHMTLVTGENRECGLSGPIGARVRRGEPLASNLGYWGGNICRAGWVAETEKDLPAGARDYIAAFAGPYFEVMNEWYGRLRIGVGGDELFRVVADNLPFDTFGIALNPGHLIHMDEWVSSPVFPGSTVPIRSGMALQADVIPTSPVYFSTRMEDGVVIADAGLREEIRRNHPECYARCQSRREFMADALGIELAEEVLPLSNIPAIVPPFFLSPNLVFRVE